MGESRGHKAALRGLLSVVTSPLGFGIVQAFGSNGLGAVGRGGQGLANDPHKT